MVSGDAVLDVAEHGLALVQLRLLVEQDPDGVARHQARLAVGRLLEPGHHPQQGRLAGAVRPDDADLRAGQERERDVVEDDLVAVRLAHGTHLIDELRHGIKPTGTRLLPSPRGLLPSLLPDFVTGLLLGFLPCLVGLAACRGARHGSGQGTVGSLDRSA